MFNNIISKHESKKKINLKKTLKINSSQPRLTLLTY